MHYTPRSWNINSLLRAWAASTVASTVRPNSTTIKLVWSPALATAEDAGHYMRSDSSFSLHALKGLRLPAIIEARKSTMCAHGMC